MYVGGTQGPSLGTPIAVYSSTGKPLPDGTAGELVATAAFPNMPVFFWSDPHNTLYYNAYFASHPHVWTHGDFVCFHPITKNLVFLGRSDGVLNPSGVRFGSAEIYGVLERGFADRVEDAICVGQRRKEEDDERVLLFLLMRDGEFVWGGGKRD